VGYWNTLPRSERMILNDFTLDVWETGGGVFRWTTCDNTTGCYAGGGIADSWENAKTDAIADALRTRPDDD